MVVGDPGFLRVSVRTRPAYFYRLATDCSGECSESSQHADPMVGATKMQRVSSARTHRRILSGLIRCIRRVPAVRWFICMASPQVGGRCSLHVKLARAFGCNLYLPRFPGHGLQAMDALRGIDAVQLRQAAAEAVAVARVLGERVVVIGTSMGGHWLPRLWLLTQRKSRHWCCGPRWCVSVMNACVYLDGLGVANSCSGLKTAVTQ